MAEVREQRDSVDGVDTRWFEADAPAGATPVLYCHGVPTGGYEWRDFLARTGGFAPDMPGFGDSAKLASFDYSIDGYARWYERFVERAGLERFSLVVHDWGGVGLALAQRMPDRIERLVVCCTVPLMEEYRWHVVARQWRRPVVGELAMGFTFKATARVLLNRSNRDPLPASYVDEVWSHFDHGTQRAILKLYRSAPPEVLGAAGARLGDITCPSLVVWGGRDPYLPVRFADLYAERLGGEATKLVIDDAGHWPWLDEPELAGEIAGFLGAR